MKTKLTPIQKKISELLKQNTGKHILDSGGAYGRNFERNEKINFLDTPKFYDNTDQYGINFTYNVFWYLTRFLDITPASKALNNKFQRYFKKNCENMFAPEIMETFVTGLIEENDEIKELTNGTVNTYNYDNLLSQVLQYVAFETETGQFIILQIHNGCDVRSGYTDPKIFELTYNTQKSESYDNFLMAQTDCTASDGDNSWDSQNSGYSFEGSGNNNEPEFKDIAIVIDNKVYNKQNGKRITFGNYEHWDGGEGETIPFILELKQWVQNNYSRPGDLAELAKEQFPDFDFDLTPFVKEYVSEIENQTLKLAL